MKLNRKHTLVALPLAALLVMGNSCETQETRDARKVDRQQEQYATAQPVPMFDWSLERDILVQLYQARNQNVATYSVWRSATGVIEDHCPSIGYGLPYDTSLTNPLRLASPNNNQSSVVEQAEPNGIFASKVTSATWVFCTVDSDKGAVIAPIYVESRVTAYPYPVTVDMERSRVTRVAGKGVSVRIEIKK